MATTRDVAFINALPLETGWSGKLWAIHNGLKQVSDGATFVWFTDADIVHGTAALCQLVAKAEADDRDLVSLMVEVVLVIRTV